MNDKKVAKGCMRRNGEHMSNVEEKVITAVMILGIIAWLVDDLTIDTQWLGALGLVVAIVAAALLKRLRSGWWL